MTVELDMGADRDERPAKPCALRFAPGRWCVLIDGHEGEHAGPSAREMPAPNYGPGGKR